MTQLIKKVRFKTLVWKYKETSFQYPGEGDLPKKKITSPQEFYELLKPLFHEAASEQFVVAWLSSSNRVIGYDITTSGLLNSSLADPRSIFRSAIVSNAASIIITHNHPSGNPEPSNEDISLTRKMVEAGKILGIPIFDHIIFCDNNYTSFVERRLI